MAEEKERRGRSNGLEFIYQSVTTNCNLLNLAFLSFDLFKESQGTHLCSFIIYYSFLCLGDKESHGSIILPSHFWHAWVIYIEYSLVSSAKFCRTLCHCIY